MTEEEKKAAEASAQATALEEAKKKEAEEAAKNAPTPEQARIAELEAERAAIIEREANYKLAYLKEVEKNKNLGHEGETEDERIRRITREELAKKEIAQIDTEKEELFKKTLKENKELKLAIQNKTPGSSTAGGGSSEQPQVTSTLVTEEQIAAFKKRGWSDADIERYKKNLLRYKV